MTKPTLPEIKVPSPDEWPASVASWQHTGQSGQFQVNVDLVRGAGRSGAIPGITLSYQTGIAASLPLASTSRYNASYLKFRSGVIAALRKKRVCCPASDTASILPVASKLK